jgi:hypothetical protein
MSPNSAWTWRVQYPLGGGRNVNSRSPEEELPMRTASSLLVVLALCAAPITAAQSAPAEGAKGGTVHSGKAPSKTGVGGQKTPRNPVGSTSHPLRQPWVKNASRSKEDSSGLRPQAPEPGTGGTKGSFITGAVTKLHKGTGSSPGVIPTTRNGARISGTGMSPKSAVAAVIRPAPKNNGMISGTGITRRN